MYITIIAVQFTMIQWNMIVHILILSLGKLILYNLVKCQAAHHSQLKMLVFVLHYTLREAQFSNTTTDVQFIMTLKNITVREETL